MASFTIIGKADSTDFARAERLSEILRAYLMHIDVKISAVLPSDWSSKMDAFCDKHRITTFDSSEEELIVLDHYRIVDDFEALVRDRYNVECDLSYEQLEKVAAENLRLAKSL